MKKKIWVRLACLFGAAVMTAGTAMVSLAAEENSGKAIKRLLPVCYHGTIAEMEGNRFTLNRQVEEGLEQVIVSITDHTRILEAVNGYPVAKDSLKAGDSVYVYVGPAMTLSLPPQTNATMILTQIPADFAVPSYEEVETLTENADGTHTVTALSGNKYTVGGETTLLPYLTRNMVYASNLQPGVDFLVWTAENGGADEAKQRARKIVIFQQDGGGYAGPSGEDAAVKSGWAQENGGWYFYDGGELAKGWLQKDGDWYYLDPETGAMRTGFLTVDGKTYYLLESGKMMTGSCEFTADENGALSPAGK